VSKITGIAISTVVGTVTSVIIVLALAPLTACDERHPTSDDTQRWQQEKLLAEGTAQTGMPAIKNFRERKLMKQIMEMRDEAGLVTYTYVQSEMTGKLIFLCDSIGFGLPYATQYTSPQKYEWKGQGAIVALPQADPNGLFSPASAEGTWVMCKDPNGSDVKPVFIEPRIVVSPFRLRNAEAYAEDDGALPLPAASNNIAPVVIPHPGSAKLPGSAGPAAGLK
jgi:hypothetical protein